MPKKKKGKKGRGGDDYDDLFDAPPARLPPATHRGFATELAWAWEHIHA